MLWQVTIISVALSLAAKFLADAYLTLRVPVVGTFAGLQYASNPGVAFSMNFGAFQNVLIVVALGAIVWVGSKAKTTVSRIAFGMIIGGALGNVIDRLRDGLVTDFVQIGTFPIFNLADSFITVGVFLLVLEAFMQWRRS